MDTLPDQKKKKKKKCLGDRDSNFWMPKEKLGHPETQDRCGGWGSRAPR